MPLDKKQQKLKKDVVIAACVIGGITAVGLAGAAAVVAAPELAAGLGAVTLGEAAVGGTAVEGGAAVAAESGAPEDLAANLGNGARDSHFEGVNPMKLRHVAGSSGEEGATLRAVQTGDRAAAAPALEDSSMDFAQNNPMYAQRMAGTTRFGGVTKSAVYSDELGSTAAMTRGDAEADSVLVSSEISSERDASAVLPAKIAKTPAATARDTEMVAGSEAGDGLTTTKGSTSTNTSRVGTRNTNTATDSSKKAADKAENDEWYAKHSRAPPEDTTPDNNYANDFADGYMIGSMSSKLPDMGSLLDDPANAELAGNLIVLGITAGGAEAVSQITRSN